MVQDEVILGDYFYFYFLPLELTSARLRYNAMIKIEQCNFCPGFLSFFSLNVLDWCEGVCVWGGGGGV